MLWSEKYRPLNYDSINGHYNTIEMLKKYDLTTIPHLIIHGGSGFGKKTIVLALLKNLYGITSKLQVKTTEVQTSSKTLEVTFLESNEYIEICPSAYNFQDKLVIQSVIKEMAQCKPVMSFFSKKKEMSIKFIVITSAHDLTQEAQAALRRTIELYSECFRIILICKQVSNIIEPIRSRCIFVRIDRYSDLDIKKTINEISEKEEFKISETEIYNIVKVSEGNMRKAISLLELNCIKKDNLTNKRQKIENSNYKLDWEMILDDVTALIKKSKKAENFIEIRKYLYNLINSCIPTKTILYELYKRLIENENFGNINKMVDLFLTYDERISNGVKGIFHLEAFIIGSACILSK